MTGMTVNGKPLRFLMDPDTPLLWALRDAANLTGTKARLLLMACLLKFGSLPPARDPDNPAPGELDAIRVALASYQAVFDTH
mgnify:CR=1 FL=1